MATSRLSDCPNILSTTAGFPEGQSLRHIIRTRYSNGMPEDFMAFIMRDVLAALSYLHVSLSTGHKEVNSSNICVDTEEFFTTIKLAVDPLKHLTHPGLAWEEGRTPTDGIWGLGITALEMGYGSLPRNCDGRANLVSLGNNVIRILKLKLEEKAIQKEKGKEKAKNKRKEKLEIADEELKKPTIKLPVPEKLLDIRYVEHQKKKLKKKKAMTVLTEKIKKAIKFFRKNKNDNADEGEFSNDDADERGFSRDFLEVVLMCLEEEKLSTAEQILERPFSSRPLMCRNLITA